MGNTSIKPAISNCTRIGLAAAHVPREQGQWITIVRGRQTCWWHALDAEVEGKVI